jgi:hypothetical protein
MAGSGFGIAPIPDLGPSPDSDVDGLPDTFEMSIGADPRQPDTDHDQLTDGFEQFQGTNPVAVDSDADGLSDGIESRLGTNPLNPDTDRDGMIDSIDQPAASGTVPGLEVGTGLFALSGPAGAAVDSDHDGLSDAWEPMLGTDPLHADTDTDGVTDSIEVAGGTDPQVPDADDDEPNQP